MTSCEQGDVVLVRFILAFVFLLELVACRPTPQPMVIATEAIPIPSPSETATLPAVTAPAERPSPRPCPGPEVVGSIELMSLPGQGKAPNGVAILQGRVYVANGGSDNVSVVEDDRVVATIPVGRYPSAIAADPATGRVYVTNRGDDTLSVIEGLEVTATISVGEAPSDVVVDHRGNRIYVANEDGKSISVIDGLSHTLLKAISTDSVIGPKKLALDPEAQRLYANVFSQVLVFNSESYGLIAAIPVDISGLVAVDPVTHRLYANDYREGNYVAVIDGQTNEIIARLPVGGDPRAMAVDAEARRLYVANSFTNDVTVIDIEADVVLTTIPVGVAPEGIAIDSASKRVYVANRGRYDLHADSLSVIDGESDRVIATIPLAINPSGAAADPVTGRLYVPVPSTDSLFVLQGDEVIARIPAGHHPLEAAVDPETGRVYVANYASRTLSVIDGATQQVIATLPVDQKLSTVDIDPLTNRIYAGDSVMDSATHEVIGSFVLRGYTIGTSIMPDIVRVNPSLNRLYVLAWNGTPGSNSRQVVYVLEGETLVQLTVLWSESVTALAVDANANRFYSADIHPIAGYASLNAYEGLDNERLLTLRLDCPVTAIGLNPITHHLYLAHFSYYPNPATNTVTILDTRTYGTLGALPVGQEPVAIALLGGRLYVVNRGDGTVTVIQDCLVPPPLAHR